MHFPLASLELGRMARRKALYGWRTALVGIALIVLIPLSLAGHPAERGGALLAGIVTFMQLVAVFLVGPTLAARSVAQAREDGPIDLVLLTGLRRWDIYLAKVLPPFLATELILLSTLPLIALAAYSGGVSVPAAVRALAIRSGWAALACVAGVWWAARTDSTRRAFVRTLLWLLGLAVLAPMAVRGLAGYGFRPGGWLTMAATRGALWVGIVLLAALAVVFAVLGMRAPGRLNPQSAETKPCGSAPGRRPPWRAPDATVSGIARLLERAGGSGAGISIGAATLVVAVFLSPLIFVGGLPFFIMAGMVLYDMLLTLEGPRRSGILEDLALSPLDDRTVVRAAWRLCLHMGLTYALSLFAAVMLPLLMSAFISGSLAGWPGGLPVLGAGALFFAVLCATMVLFLAALACRVSLTQSGGQRGIALRFAQAIAVAGAYHVLTLILCLMIAVAVATDVDRPLLAGIALPGTLALLSGIYALACRSGLSECERGMRKG